MARDTGGRLTHGLRGPPARAPILAALTAFAACRAPAPPAAVVPCSATERAPSTDAGTAPLPSDRLRQLEQFVRLGYGDLIDAPVRSLDFLTDELTTDEAARVVTLVPSYNAFDGSKVARVVTRFRGRISKWEFGRESSPVLYVDLPYWTHQREGAPAGVRAKIGDAEHEKLLKELRAAFVDELGADEFAADEIQKRRVRIWWD
jgi:hypothetical protein